MQIDLSLVITGLVGAICSVVGFMVRKLLTKVDVLVVDVAVIKKQIERSEDDHDKVILLEQQSTAAHRRIDELHTKKECAS